MTNQRLLLPAMVLALLPGMVSALCATPGKDGSATIGATPGGLAYFSSTASVAAGATTIPVSSTSGLAAGDLVLVIQMQGADINSNNTSSYGDGSGSGSGYLSNANLTAGQYEYGVVQSVGGTSITLTAGLTHSYVDAAYGTAGQRRYQVVRVPQYGNLTLSADITAPAWNGSTGGVLALDVAGDLNFNGHVIGMDVRGFRGGLGRQLTGGNRGANTDYRNLATRNYHGDKGEGIAGTPHYVWEELTDTAVNTGMEGYPNGSTARGAPGTAGGGGTDGNPSANDQNSGGGGGGNGGAGAQGGNSWSSNLPVGGHGGAIFAQASVARVVMGGGGGSGSRNNSSGNESSGGQGGGIVMLRVSRLVGPGTVSANGGVGSTPANDGGGGGGAGGSIIVLAGAQTGSLALDARGGAGGNADVGGVAHGPGGGGGGGVVFTNATVAATVDTTQGPSGYAVSAGNYYGATASGGNPGGTVPNSDPAAVVGADSGYECMPPVLTVTKAADVTSAAPGTQITYTVTVTNSNYGKAYNVVLTDAFSPFTSFVPGGMAGADFQFIDSATNPSGLSLPATTQYSENNGSTYSNMPGTTGWETRLTNWKINMSGTMNTNGQFSIRYKALVK
jgi:uncharacterized repeat protein (TIGR01451 family)